jgi:hypothetical protein
MNIDTNVFWEIIIGITTGVYAGFIVSRMARFSALTGEALRLVRGIDFIYGDVAQEAVTLLKIEEALAQFTLISSDFYSRGHRKAGDNVNTIGQEFGEVTATRPLTKEFMSRYVDWQRRVRTHPANLWAIFKPWLRIGEL